MSGIMRALIRPAGTIVAEGDALRSNAEPWTHRAWRQIVQTFSPWKACTVALAEDATEVVESQESETRTLADLEGRETQELADILERYRELHLEEEERKKAVNERLTSVLSLSSVVTAITFGFFSVAFDRSLVERLGGLQWIAVVVFVYTLGQLLISVLWAVKGLKISFVQEAFPDDILRRPAETREQFLCRAIRNHSGLLSSHDQAATKKADSLEVAHRGIINFLLGTVVLVMLLLVGAWWGVKPSKETTPVRIQADDALIERLRGPQGPPGVQGPAGPAGPRGPPGPVGKPRTRSQTR